MKIFKQYAVVLLVVQLVLAAGLQAQSINGDTIFVDNQAEVVVSFPSMPSNATTTPIDAPYNFIAFGTGFSVRAKLKNTRPVPWVVIEGKRTHHFWIVYKRINYNNPEELHYDYSSVKKIGERIRHQEASRSQANNSDDSKPDTKKTGKDKNDDKDNVSFKYYSLLESGDQKLKKQEYSEAKIDFDKAIAMRPGEVYPKQKLEEVKLKLAEKTKKENLKLQEVYKGYIAAGEKAFKQNNLAEARTSFEQALVIVSDDKAAKKRISQIEEKEKELKQSEELENNYNAAVTAGDKAFQKENYDDAKDHYTRALSFIKKPGPQEQINEISRIIKEKAEKETASKTAKAQEKENAQKEKELQATKKKYYAALQSADKLFAKGDLEKAKTGYNKALEIMDDSWPKEQIAKIDKTFADQAVKEKTEKGKLAAKLEKDKKEKAEQELENKYNTALQTADKFFKDENYINARPAYVAALAIIKKPWPQEQIAKIDKIFADMLVQQKAEKERLARETALNTKYKSAIEEADKEFAKVNYTRAKKLYQNAMAVKPAETYPRQKLNDIQSALDRLAAEEKERKERIAAEQELKKNYDIALSKAKYFFLKEDLENALIFYTEANRLKPAEAEPHDQVKNITAKLTEIAKLKAVTEKYEAKITVADSQLIAKNYEAAKAAYSEAAAIKPSETYPTSQIKYIVAEVKTSQRVKEENDKFEAIRLENEKDTKYHEWIKLADKSVVDYDFAKAKQQYAEALKYRPESEYAKRRFKIASDQFEKTRSVVKGNEQANPDKTVKYADEVKAVNPVVPEKQGKSPYAFQAEPLPYTAEELKAKYPGIDFSTLPPDQPFNEDAVDSKENTKMFNEVLTDKPRLDISDKSQKVKLICQGINFMDRNVYVKLLIQNNSDNDFLTGAMMLTWTRKLGNHIKLYPLYLYPSVLPVIKPGNESVVIYVCKSYSIADDEKLKFELSDRSNKTKLELNFRGSVYNEESVRF